MRSAAADALRELVPPAAVDMSLGGASASDATAPVAAAVSSVFSSGWGPADGYSSAFAHSKDQGVGVWATGHTEGEVVPARDAAAAALLASMLAVPLVDEQGSREGEEGEGGRPADTLSMKR